MSEQENRETAGGIVVLTALVVFVLLSVAIWLSAFGVGSKCVLEACLVALVGIGAAWIVKAT